MDGYIGEIKMFAGQIAPKNWTFCEGQAVSIERYPALFSVISNRFGGDGVLTFNLPDFRGRIPVGSGEGDGLTERVFTSSFGSESISLAESQLPTHSHPVDQSLVLLGQGNGDTNVGEDNALATEGRGNVTEDIYNTVPPSIQTDTNTLSISLGSSGAADTVEVSQPSITINFIICLTKGE